MASLRQQPKSLWQLHTYKCNQTCGFYQVNKDFCLTNDVTCPVRYIFSEAQEKISWICRWRWHTLCSILHRVYCNISLFAVPLLIILHALHTYVLIEQSLIYTRPSIILGIIRVNAFSWWDIENWKIYKNKSTKHAQANSIMYHRIVQHTTCVRTYTYNV